MSDKCSACGTPYEPGEVRTLLSNGTTVHEDAQPASMRRCRDALLAKQASMLAILREVGNAETEGCEGCGTIGIATINGACELLGWEKI